MAPVGICFRNHLLACGMHDRRFASTECMHVPAVVGERGGCTVRLFRIFWSQRHGK